MSGHKRDPKIPQEKKKLPHGWIVVPSKTYPDRVYYFNTVTKCSTWNNPCDASRRKTPESSRSKSSSPSRKRSRKKTRDTSEPNKKIQSPVECNTTKINNEIEDYDEQNDQYFNNVDVNAFTLSHSRAMSPSSSPDSIFSLVTDISDLDSSKWNALVGSSGKVHVSTPPNNTMRKSVDHSDFNVPSTSHRNLGMETIEDQEIPESFLKCKSSKYPAVSETKKKKSKKKKLKDDEKKRIEDKLIKSVSFKKRDKTPAQSQLLKLRKQNAETLKELATNHPDLFSSKTSGFFKARIFDIKEQANSENNIEEKIDICEDLTDEIGNHPKDEFTEEMDWEPSSEEADVRNINEFRQQIERVNESSSENSFGELHSDHSFPVSKTHSWFVVLDTNIFVSCLGFVKELRDMKIQSLGSPTIYVPWRVLQELDHLKDTKLGGMNKRIHFNVRKAISYLNENFKLRHPKVFGQSFEDFAKMVDTNTFAPDDEILQTCIKFQRQHPTKRLMLLTNDKNLESKAIVSGVEVYSKESFHKKFIKSRSPSPAFNSSSSKATESSSQNTRSVAVDNSLCEIKSILNDFIPVVVETEMKIAFEGDWIKLAFKKPPWNLQDALDCLFKHWRSVFFVVFSKETQSEAQRLYDWLFKKEPESAEDVEEIICITQRLIQSIKKFQKKKRPYLDLIDAISEKLSNVQCPPSTNSTIPSLEVERGVSPLLSSVSTQAGSFFRTNVSQNAQVPINNVSGVKNLFKDIWDSLRNFCCSVSDIIHSSSSCDIQAVRLKMSETITQLTELVVIMEKIFEVSPAEINENHPLISHFSNFLIRVHPGMDPELNRDLPNSLAAFFTDFEGRSLLCNSLRDFKEFSRDLMNAIDYFNTHSTS